METYSDVSPLSKIETGVEGLEHITSGGLIEGRTTLISGSSGSGKTLLSIEALYRGCHDFGRPAVFVTFEERPADIVRNVKTFGWDLSSLIEDGRLIVLDASPSNRPAEVSGDFDISGIIAQVSHAVEMIDAKFVVLDSVGSFFQQMPGGRDLRHEMLRLVDTMRDRGVTSVMTAERDSEYGPVSRLGIEEFVSDTVVILRHDLNKENVRRTVQVYKMRGAEHSKGEFPFVIDSRGIHMMPLSAAKLTQQSTYERLTFGEPTFDKLAGGGLFRDSIVLVSGPTGGGKTLMCTTFASEGCKQGERVLYLGFEESEQQLDRNADSWGVEFPAFREDGLLRVVSVYPESRGFEGHLLSIKQQIEEFQPKRLIIDSVSALERVGEVRFFREFVIGLTSFVKQHQVCTLLTSTTPELSGGESVTEAHISTITDAIILLRYVEIAGSLRRGLIVIKMRGSQHGKDVHEFVIGDDGMTIGEPFRNVPNLLVGIPSASELEGGDGETLIKENPPPPAGGSGFMAKAIKRG